MGVYRLLPKKELDLDERNAVDPDFIYILLTADADVITTLCNFSAGYGSAIFAELNVQVVSDRRGPQPTRFRIELLEVHVSELLHPAPWGLSMLSTHYNETLLLHFQPA